MIGKLLNEHHLEFLSLKGGCSGSSKSKLVKTPHCWKSHVTAHLFSCRFQWKNQRGVNLISQREKRGQVAAGVCIGAEDPDKVLGVKAVALQRGEDESL